MTGVPFPHSDLLAQSMPDDSYLDVLRICLTPQRGMAEHLLVGDRLVTLLRQRAGARRLLPLLRAGLRQAGIRAAPGIDTLLHTAVLWEQTRFQRLERVLSETMGLLEEAGLETLVVGGFACSLIAYPPDAPRHCHDLDLAFDPARLGDAEALLCRSGCTATAAPTSRHRILTHPSGLAIGLHAVDRKAERQGLPGTPYRTLRVPDALAQLLIHSARSPRLHDWNWAADATLLHRASPDRQAFDSRILGLAAEARAALPMGYRLQWLTAAGLIADADELASELAVLARRERLTESAPYLRAACSASGQGGRQLFNRSGLRSRIAIGAWIASNRLRKPFR